MVGFGWITLERFNLWDAKLKKAREYFTLILHSLVEALRLVMESMLQHLSCQSFETDCKDLIAKLKEPQDWPSFAIWLKAIKTLQICFPDFKIYHIPAKTARSFYRELYYISFSIRYGLSNRIAVRCKKKKTKCTLMFIFWKQV